MDVVGVPVAPELVSRWRGWFAPAEQPFVVTEALRAQVGSEAVGQLPLELKDTFCLYGEDTLARTVTLDRDAFSVLPSDVRAGLVRYQATFGRRLVPSLRSMDPISLSAALRRR